MITGVQGHRIFVDLTTGGCPCSCKYCFVDRGPDTPVDENAIRDIVPNLLSCPGFHPGRDGTIIALGSHADLFRTARLASVLIKALGHISELKNPVQISTKHRVGTQWARLIASQAHYRNQVVIFVSCPSLQSADDIEPGVDIPLERLQNLRTLREEGLASCLHIMPFLPGLTDRQADGFCSVLHEYQPDVCCIGALFVDAILRKRLRLSTAWRSDESVGHPLFLQADTLVQPNWDFVHTLMLAEPKIPFFESSVCALSTLQERSCPIHSDGCPPRRDTTGAQSGSLENLEESFSHPNR